MQYDANCSSEGMSGWNQVAPFSRKERIENISNPIESKKPHEEEVVRKALGKLIFEMEVVIEPPWKEPEHRPVPESNTVNVMCIEPFVLRIGPIDENARVDHHEQQGEIDPVHPASRQRMLVLNSDLCPISCSGFGFAVSVRFLSWRAQSRSINLGGLMLLGRGCFFWRTRRIILPNVLALVHNVTALQLGVLAYRFSLEDEAA